ncbi:PqqD family protein [Ectobacillus funiculus]|uniref:PqqD family protein n=1 Tax=Ectobacillus funiculus TaxID=137993 RepID=UPI00397E24E9
MSIKYECKENIDILEIDNDCIIMDTETFTVTKINAMGAYILHGVKEKREIEDIIGSIAADYDVELDVAKTDTLAFLKELEEISLIRNERI